MDHTPSQLPNGQLGSAAADAGAAEGRGGLAGRRTPLSIALGTVLALLAMTLAPAVAQADPTPTDGSPATVAGDPLPTVQIDGVVWTQVVVGNTVYAGGNFSAARPAGAAPGQDEVTRTHLLAYDIRTGELDPDFAPVLNGQVLSLTKSPDGSRIYAGGEFSNVNGSGRWRVAAFDTATGELVGNFAPSAGATVRAVVASESAIYIGGDFQTASGEARSRVAAFSPADGSLLPFDPSADASVTAMTLNPSGSLLVLGGRFTTLAGGSSYGMGAVDAASGELRPWGIESVVRNAGSKASINALVADGDSVYGTGYTFGSGGNFEGTFRADGETGEVSWISDCHGDHYSVFPQGDAVYNASHAHYCGNVPDGFLQSNPWGYYSSGAYTKDAIAPNEYNDLYGYASFDGQPSPQLLHWYPVWSTGSFTGQHQAGWNVAGNDEYVLYGGEFTKINGKPQQGLVRFAKPGLGPNKTAPQRTEGLIPAAISVEAGQVELGWQATFDRDSRSLEYRVYRDFTGWSNKPVHTVVVDSKPWQRPTITFTDTGLEPGATHTYRVYAFDAAGNNIRNGETSVSVVGETGVDLYGQAVLASQPEHWWRMDDATGQTLADSRGSATAFAPSTITGGAEGATTGSGTSISLVNGGNSFAATEVSQIAPQVFSVEAWIKTTEGGRVIGHGDRATGTSRRDWSDRHLYLDDTGRVHFGVRDGNKKSIQSEAGYNDNEWHHLVGTLGPDGMRLYVDGALVDAREDVTAAMNIEGHWRIGRDTLRNWGSRPSSDGFTGQVDEAAVYHRVLSEQEVADHFAAASGIAPPNQEPQAVFATTVDGLSVAVDGSESSDLDGVLASYHWDFGDGTEATGATASHSYAADGTYEITLTVTDDAGATGVSSESVSVEQPPNQVPTAEFTVEVDGLSVDLDASASVDPDGSIADYAWDFGDGATGDGATASHSYAADGTYEITLTVTDDAGATGVSSESVSVEQPPNQVPTAEFTVEVDGLSVDLDASASVDPDGSIADYAWDFGDGATGNGATVSHSYASGGTFDVTLTVTDAEGGSGSATVPVTVTDPADPGDPGDPAASFAADTFTRSVNGGWGSAEQGGVWSLGGGSQNFAVDGTTGVLTVPQGGRSASAYLKSVEAVDQDLTFTWTPEAIANGGGTYLNVAVRGDASNAYRAKVHVSASGSVRVQLVRVVNGGQTVLDTFTVPGLTATAGEPLNVRVQALGAEPTQLAAKVWPAAGSEPAEWAVQATDGTAALQDAGGLGLFVYVSGSASNTPISYRIDDLVATGSEPGAPQAPTASFAAVADGLGVSVDGSASADPDGSIVEYAWDFGDGSTGSGATTGHTYPAAGNYDVTLTVTDNDGATDSQTQTVSVAQPGEPVVIAADGFARSVNGGWGSAEQGGAWSLGGGSQNFAVDGSAAVMTVQSGGRSVSAYLKDVAEVDQDLTLSWTPEAIANGGGTYLNVAVRGDASNAYRAKLQVRANGTARLQLVRVLNGAQSVLATKELTGLTVEAGSTLNVRVSALGSGTTQLGAKVWLDGTDEPDWAVTATDGSAELQDAGGLGLFVYVSGSASNTPISYRVDDLTALRPE